jgi:hypothetical protein
MDDAGRARKEAPGAPPSGGELPAVRSRGRKRDDPMHTVRAAKHGEFEGPPEKAWHLRTRPDCVARGLHAIERDAFIGLTYCRWCGFTE